MNYEDYYENRLPEARELFNSNQLKTFIESCLNEGLKIWSSDYNFFEDKLQIRKGTLKYLPKELVSKLDFDDMLKREQVFHAYLEMSEINFDKLLQEHIELFKKFPGVKVYNLFYLFEGRMARQNVVISYHDQKITITGLEDNKLFDIIDYQQITILTEDNEKRRINLDRPIQERLDEFICGIENHYGVDGTLIESNKVILLDNNIEPSNEELESVCLFLSNNDVQKGIYSQDIVIFSPFIKEVKEYRVNNSWHKLMMPKYMIDTWIQYINYFKSWIKLTKGIVLDIEFVEEQDFIIVKISSRKALSDYTLSLWFKDYIKFLNNEANPSKTDFKTNTNNKGLIVRKLQQQVQIFKSDIKLSEILENRHIEMLQEINETIDGISDSNGSLFIQIVNGGTNQIAKEINNLGGLIN